MEGTQEGGGILGCCVVAVAASSQVSLLWMAHPEGLGTKGGEAGWGMGGDGA